MSTSRSPSLSGPSKKISSWVRPGVCEVRASALRPVSALIRLDLPTLERPANATSMPAIGGSVSIDGEAQTNFHSPAKSFRPSSISFASMSALMRRFHIIVMAGHSSLPCADYVHLSALPAIHVFLYRRHRKDVDARHKAGHDVLDGIVIRRSSSWSQS